jgi:hypothetical protein
VEGKINDQPIFILIDSGAIHSYIDPNIVGDFICKEESLRNIGYFS